MPVPTCPSPEQPVVSGSYQRDPRLTHAIEISGAHQIFYTPYPSPNSSQGVPTPPPTYAVDLDDARAWLTCLHEAGDSIDHVPTPSPAAAELAWSMRELWHAAFYDEELDKDTECEKKWKRQMKQAIKRPRYEQLDVSSSSDRSSKRFKNSAGGHGGQHKSHSHTGGGAVVSWRQHALKHSTL